MTPNTTAMTPRMSTHHQTPRPSSESDTGVTEETDEFSLSLMRSIYSTRCDIPEGYRSRIPKGRVMPNPIVARLTRPAIERWLASADQSWRNLAVPPAEDTQHARGSDADRLLLIGSGLAVGYGHTSHDDALAGQLARQISALTGRGSRVDVVTAPNMSAANMVEILDAQRLDGLDAIIAMPLGIESLFIISRSRWRRHLRDLLDHISAAAPRSVQLYLVAVPKVAELSDLPRGIAALSRRAHRRLNVDLERFCGAHPQATFVPLGVVERADKDSSAQMYSNLAGVIAPYVARGLSDQFAGS